MKLLFITHKIHEKDDDFAFASLWIKEFIRQGFEVEVICLFKGVHSGDFPVFSLGKERGASIFASLKEFWRLITSLKYDRVFVHMNPKWMMAGAPYWWIKRTAVYLWYTHYTRPISLRISHLLCKRIFAATSESLPQYNNDEKKVVTGHGIDMGFWERPEIPSSNKRPKTDLLSVHRICRSKRPHLAIRALSFLPAEYNLTIYGRVLEEDYYSELRNLITGLDLDSRVKFMGSVPMPELKNIYPNYHILINMAPATIDKTILEGMLSGAQPVTTAGNAKAIGLPDSPTEATSQAIADYILKMKFLTAAELKDIVRSRHSLESLIKKMSQYIIAGI